MPVRLAGGEVAVSQVDQRGRHAFSRDGVVALLVCCVATGCFRAEEEALDEAQAVSLALTRGIRFDGGQVESGPLPKETMSRVFATLAEVPKLRETVDGEFDIGPPRKL